MMEHAIFFGRAKFKIIKSVLTFIAHGAAAQCQQEEDDHILLDFHGSYAWCPDGPGSSRNFHTAAYCINEVKTSNFNNCEHFPHFKILTYNLEEF
jgi:hypothetical protein